MRLIPSVWRLLLLLLCGAGAAPVQAYYDDVHYALTYYIARQVGYTPEQAYRVAKANLSVDYAYPTEPVQASSAYAGAKAFAATESAQEPRWRFHAFRNEYQFAGVTDRAVGKRHPLAVQADTAINTQRVKLWTQAIEEGNPGIFLHFLQDQEPHAGYGSAYGHWPIVWQKDIDNALAHHLPLGGSTDWLDFRGEASNLALVKSTFEALALYLKKVAPGQHQRTFVASEFTDLLRQLRQVNPAPAPLADALLETFTEVRTDMVKGFNWDLIGHYANKHQLSASQANDANLHQFGPNLPRAVSVVNAEMKRRGLSPYGSWETPETLPAAPSGADAGYALDGQGHLQNPQQADDFVLTGTLTVTVERASPSTGNAAGKVPGKALGNVQVSLLLAKTRAPLEEKERRIGEPRSIPVGATPVKFERVPIGGLIVEVSEAGQAPVRVPYLLDERSGAITLTLAARADEPPSSALTDNLKQEASRLAELLATLRGLRDQAAQQFEAALAALQGELAKRAATPALPAGGAKAGAAKAASLIATEASAVCARIDAAAQRLAATLAKLETDQQQLETFLQQAQQRATRCTDAADITAAEQALQQAQTLATGIDQQATALALLAVQVDDLTLQRQQLLQRRAAAQSVTTSQAAGSQAATANIAALNAALAAWQAFDRPWSVAEADRERPGLLQMAAAIDQADVSQRPARRVLLRSLQQLVDAIAALGHGPRELQQAQARVTALVKRANIGAPAAHGKAAAAIDVTAADFAGCLDQAPPDLVQGMEKADTSRALAQLALAKLGASVQSQLQICRQKLAPPLDPVAAVAAKTCKYAGSEAFWDETKKRAMCRCPAGKQWSRDKSECVADRQTQVAQHRCTAVNTEPYWDAQTQAASCRCQTGYVYSDIFQQCEVDWRAEVRTKDCSAFAHTEAYWDVDHARAACRCASDYQRDAKSNSCVADIKAQVAHTDCSRWPNSAPRWDAEHNNVQCQCITGYRYNSRSQACERDIKALLANTDCSRWQNSAPVWNRDEQKVSCECIAGTHYNSAAERCERELSASEQVAALDCSADANSVAYWDRDENQAKCHCRAGYESVFFGGTCEAKPVVIACDTVSESGSNPPQTITVNIGTHVGTATLHYEMFEVHDRMVVEYGGRTIADTGCVSGSGSMNLDLSGYSSQVIIQVLPNCRGSTDTKWNFTLNCPQ